MYKNSEGYRDPTAGEAFRGENCERAQKSRERRLEEVQAREDFEVAIRAVRELAEQHGFSFTRDVWLIKIKTGKVYREFERR